MLQPIVRQRIRRHWDQFVKNPRWMIMDIASRFYSIRRVIKWFRKFSEVSDYEEIQSLFDIDTTTAIKNLEQKGISQGLKLPDDIVTNIQQFARTQPCYGNGKAALGFVYGQKEAAQEVANEHFSQAIFLHHEKKLSVIQEIAEDPKLLSTIGEYFGTKPMFVGSRLWWTFSSEEDQFDVTNTSAFFHFDKDDYAAIRVFFYLNDVDEENGPHQAVLGSHRNKKLKQMLSLGQRSYQQMMEQYSEEQILTVCGPSGSGFIEDPFILHRATRPEKRDRLILQLRYATRDYNIFPNPAENELSTIELSARELAAA